MLKKRGSAHFEMVISMIFFITFVLFMLAVLKPYEKSTITNSIVDEIYGTFQEQAATNYSTFLVKIENPDPTICDKISLPQNLKYPLTKSIVKNIDNLALPQDENSGIEYGHIHLGGSAQFYKISMSPEFVAGTLSSCTITTDYTIGSINERRLISNKSLVTMKKNYYLDYPSLKEKLKIPEVFDFAITFEEKPELDMKTPTPNSIDIVAEKYTIEILYADGTINNTEVIFTTW